MHAGVHGAPFGGVGGSGNGYYHGKYGYLSFTHLRTVVEPPEFLEEALSFRYPPYSLENIAKVATEDTHGIKPVETMEDQEILVPKLENGAS
jgi:aldehyde dehydrogenase (NAD+)